MEKWTKKDSFALLRTLIPTDHPKADELIAFIDNEVAILAKRNANRKKSNHLSPAEQAKANADIALERQIIDILSDGVTRQPKDIAGVLGLTTQKLTQRLSNLVKSGQVVKDDKKSLYTIGHVVHDETGDDETEEVGE